jgi:hypothetical protein
MRWARAFALSLTIEWLQMLREYRDAPAPAPRARRDPGVMSESELRAELLYSSRPPRFCDFDAAWRARSAPRSSALQVCLQKESPWLGS